MSTVGKVINCKAAVVWEFKKPVSIETIQVQPPGDGEVRIKMVAVGLCHSDLSFVDGFVQDQPLPFVIGHEGAGIVESIGQGVKNVKPGDKVFTLFMSQCDQCYVCKDGRSNSCLDIGRTETRKFPYLRSLGYDGTPRFFCKGKPIHHMLGASSFSEYTVIHENSCVKVNPKTPLEKACIMACGFTTGYGSSANAVAIRPGDITVVWGMGGVGLATVVGCKDKGAGRIIGIDVNPNKEVIARKLGCTDFICAKNLPKPINQLIMEMTNGGAHFTFACIGVPEVMVMATMSTKVGGTAVLVGITPDTALISVPPAFLMPSRKIIGTIIGEYRILDDIPKLVDRYLEGKLPIDDFITGNYKLDEINEAMDQMRAGKTIRSIILM